MHSPITSWRIAHGRVVDTRRSPVLKSRLASIHTCLVRLRGANRATSLLISLAPPIGPAARSAATAFHHLHVTETEFHRVLTGRLIDVQEAQMAADALAAHALATKSALEALARARADTGAVADARRFAEWAEVAFELTALAKTLRAEVL